MQARRIGDSDRVTIQVEHKNTIVGYNLSFDYNGSGALKIRGPIVADVDYDYVVDHIMRIGGFKRKHREELLEQMKKVVPPTMEILA